MTEPFTAGFEYEIELATRMPLEWTTLLKTISAHHYDYKCREAGDRGVVNGLHNTALGYKEFREERGDEAECVGYTFGLSWSDLDLLCKIMEQARHHSDDMGLLVRMSRWLRDTKQRIETEYTRVMGGAS